MLDAAYEKFKVGHKDVAIDDNGIVMAAIQSLYKKVRAQEKVLAAQEARLQAQEQAIRGLSGLSENDVR